MNQFGLVTADQGRRKAVQQPCRFASCPASLQVLVERIRLVEGGTCLEMVGLPLLAVGQFRNQADAASSVVLHRAALVEPVEIAKGATPPCDTESVGQCIADDP